MAKKCMIVGLGNPGASYSSTRHNMGFMLVDKIAAKYGAKLKDDGFGYLVGNCKVKGVDVLLTKPMLYMNNSGVPVYKAFLVNSVCIEDLLVLHDDVDISFGRLKIRERGDGGHNGVKSLASTFGTDRFTRLRMGIGRPAGSCCIVDHVLGEFSEQEGAMLDQFISMGLTAVTTILYSGVGLAMSLFNGKNGLKLNV